MKFDIRSKYSDSKNVRVLEIKIWKCSVLKFIENQKLFKILRFWKNRKETTWRKEWENVLGWPNTTNLWCAASGKDRSGWCIEPPYITGLGEADDAALGFLNRLPRRRHITVHDSSAGCLSASTCRFLWPFPDSGRRCSLCCRSAALAGAPCSTARCSVTYGARRSGSAATTPPTLFTPSSDPPTGRRYFLCSSATGYRNSGRYVATFTLYTVVPPILCALLL
jgi:hypothetical protein